MLNDELDPLDNLDTVIGDVAKAMTEAKADVDLARRVSMRIADAGERGSAWTRPWVLVPIASACALMLAVFIAREGSVPLKPDATSVATPPVVGRPFQGRRGGAESPAPQGAVIRAPKALPELAPQAIAPIEIDRLSLQPIVEMSAIDIKPIAIDRIEISEMP